MTLRGPTVAADFQKIVIDYIERRFGSPARDERRRSKPTAIASAAAMRRISSGWTFFYKRVFPAIVGSRFS